MTTALAMTVVCAVGVVAAVVPFMEFPPPASQQAWGRVRVGGPHPETKCRGYIEIHDTDSSRIGCVDAPLLSACGALIAGDRVDVDGARCLRVPEGMASDWRAALGLPVLLERATRADFERVSGIGPKLSQRIMDYLAEHAPVRSVADLGAVSGIGPARLSTLSRHFAASLR